MSLCFSLRLPKQQVDFIANDEQALKYFKFKLNFFSSCTHFLRLSGVIIRLLAIHDSFDGDKNGTLLLGI